MGGCQFSYTVSHMAQWFEEDDFWVSFREMMYDPQRLASTGEDVRQMIDLCRLRPGMKVLDHCCGLGRHALEFARLGYAVCGVDRCGAYLSQARAKSQKRSLDIAWYQQDIRELNIDEQFHFAYNFFTSFGYIEDPEEEMKSLRLVYKHMLPGGQFLIDLQGKELLARDQPQNEWFDGQDGSVMLVQVKPIDNWCRIENRWAYIKDNHYTERVFTHNIYSAKEIADLLLAAGFGSVECYGSLAGIPYDIDAQRLIVIAKKE